MVEWKVKVDEYKGQTRVSQHFLGTHKCDEKDMALFFPFSTQEQAYLDKLRAQNALICIDRDEVLELRGKDEIDGIVINFDFMICNPQERNYCSHESLD
jgi:hypothetical protein